MANTKTKTKPRKTAKKSASKGKAEPRQPENQWDMNSPKREQHPANQPQNDWQRTNNEVMEDEDTEVGA
jgi:hypothetical protein